MFLSTAGPSTFDFAVVPAGSIESGVRRMLTENVATSDLECIQGSGLIPLHETAVADHVGRQYGGEPTLRAILVNALSTSRRTPTQGQVYQTTRSEGHRAPSSLTKFATGCTAALTARSAHPAISPNVPRSAIRLWPKVLPNPSAARTQPASRPRLAPISPR